MIDLHFHLLPGLDDGPPDLTRAVALARAASATGTTTVVATPHVSWRWPDNDALRIADAVLLIKRELRARDIELDVRRGAEVALTRAADLSHQELARLGLGGRDWILLECPSEAGASTLQAEVRRLLGDGHRFVLSHPERIVAFRNDPATLTRLVNDGVRCQVTAGAFDGRFGKDAKRFAGWMVGEGLVHVVASDAHSTAGRPPSVLPELRRAGLPRTLIQWLTEEAPRALLAGADLPRTPAGHVDSRRRHVGGG